MLNCYTLHINMCKLACSEVYAKAKKLPLVFHLNLGYSVRLFYTCVSDFYSSLTGLITLQERQPLFLGRTVAPFTSQTAEKIQIIAPQPLLLGGFPWSVIHCE